MLMRRLSLLLALVWMAYIFYLSHQPSLDLPSLFENQDKVMHFVTYGILGVFLLGAMALPPAGYGTAQVALATLIASLYGISDEFHQSFVPGRTPDVVDWIADTSGALLAALLLARLSRSFSRSRRPC
jgi:VanZ family protein